MEAAFFRVTESERLYGRTFVTWFAGSRIPRSARPGQFVMLRCADLSAKALAERPEGPFFGSDLAHDPLLPRPMSIHRLRQGESGDEFAVLYDVVGRGTEWLARRRPGDVVYGWGPLGRGFAVGRSSHHLLLVAGGIGIAPLVWLAEEQVRRGRSVTLIAGGRNAEQIFPARLLPPEVEFVVTTEDGSAGRRGLATDAFAELLEWADQVFACGPNAMFQAMARIVREARVRRSVQVLVEERMGCGTGICYGCAVETRKGMRLVCKDGPRFDLRDLW
ncbi:MAG TPA: dihydroorotate dehydrogenase electron transfer subunit [Dehalococcoidia bacterium]|nr:dihydroorotate dehydrogenase electron transfer subunit [Dehalococcoidia bacterium]